MGQRHHVEATLIDQRKELLAEHEGLEAQDSARLEVLSDCFRLFRSFQDWTQNLVDNDEQEPCGQPLEGGVTAWLLVALEAYSIYSSYCRVSLELPGRFESKLAFRAGHEESDAVRAIPVLALAGVGGQLLSM